MAVNLNSAALNAFRNLVNAAQTGNVNENTIIHKDGEGFKSGGVWSEKNKLRWVRFSSTKRANNEIRSSLLESLGRAFNIEGMGRNAQGKCTFTPAFMATLRQKLGDDVFKEGNFGLSHGVVDSGKPLTQRRIAAIVTAADAAIAREINEARENEVPVQHEQNDGRVVDEDGYTVVDNPIFNARPIEAEEDVEIAPEQLMRQVEERDDNEEVRSNADEEIRNAENPEQAQRTEKERAVQQAHDKRLNELKDQVKAARTAAKARCMELCDGIVKELAKNARAGQGVKQEILAKTLEKHGAGFYENLVDEKLQYVQYEEVDDPLLIDESQNREDAPEPDDPAALAEKSEDVAALKKELEFLQSEFGVEDFKAEVGERAGNLGDAIDEAIASSKTAFVDEDAFCVILNKHGVGYGHDLRTTPARMFHNAQVRENVHASCAKFRAAVEKFFANDGKGVGAELPDVKARLQKELDEKLQAFEGSVSGDLDVKKRDDQEINRAFVAFQESFRAELDEAKASAASRAAAREEVLKNVTLFVQEKNVVFAPRLGEEDMHRLNDMLAHPQGALKESLERAVDAQLENKLGISGEYYRTFTTAFMKLANELVAQREAEGAELLKDLAAEFSKDAFFFFEKGNANALSSLNNMSLYTDTLTDLNKAKPFGKLRDAAIQHAANKLKSLKRTPSELARNKIDLRNAFRENVSNAILRAEYMRRSIDALEEKDAFQKKVFTLCKDKKLGMSGLINKTLNTEGQKRLDAAKAEVRLLMCMNAVKDDDMALREIGPDELEGAFQEKFLQELTLAL